MRLVSPLPPARLQHHDLVTRGEGGIMASAT